MALLRSVLYGVDCPDVGERGAKCRSSGFLLWGKGALVFAPWRVRSADPRVSVRAREQACRRTQSVSFIPAGRAWRELSHLWGDAEARALRGEAVDTSMHGRPWWSFAVPRSEWIPVRHLRMLASSLVILAEAGGRFGSSGSPQGDAGLGSRAAARAAARDR